MAAERLNLAKQSKARTRTHTHTHTHVDTDTHVFNLVSQPSFAFFSLSIFISILGADALIMPSSPQQQSHPHQALMHPTVSSQVTAVSHSHTRQRERDIPALTSSPSTLMTLQLASLSPAPHLFIDSKKKKKTPNIKKYQ